MVNGFTTRRGGILPPVISKGDVGILNLIILGPSGAGKGTQALMLAEHYGIEHISTGNILRDEVKRGTDLGHMVEDLMELGQLVDDDLMTPIVRAVVNRDNFILDGYPRTSAQANVLDLLLKQANVVLDKALSVEVDDESIVRRLRGRVVCPICEATFHLTYSPPDRQGKCDRCNRDLIQRLDDMADTVRRRLAIYHRRTEPILEHYAKKGILVRVSGLGAKEAIFKELTAAIGPIKPK
jgi:adenylate kinase